MDVASWHRAGSAAESSRETGASFLLERLALSGAWSPAAARALEELRAAGGTRGGTTTPDFASFHETLPPEALDVALRLEAARLTPPEISAPGLRRQRGQAAEAMRRLGDGGPTGRALERLYAEVFGSHPYGRRVAGDPARDSLGAAGFRSFAATHYGPPTTCITIVGRFDPDSALALARRTVGAVPRRAAAGSRKPPSPPAARRAEMAGDAPLPMLAAAWRLPGGSDSARAAFPVIARLLLQGPGSRLQRQLAVGPTAPFLRLEGAIVENAEATLLYFVAILRANVDTAAVGAAIRAAAERLGREEVGADELGGARRQVELSRLRDRATARGRALALGSAWMVNGSWRAADADLETVRSLGAGEVRDIAARVLVPEALTEVWITPDPSRRSPP